MKKMKSGDNCTYGSGNILIMGWKDTKMMLIMSTYRDKSLGKKKW
jgi:hypothetical protein